MAKYWRTFFSQRKPSTINVSFVLGLLAHLIALLMTEPLDGVIAHGHISIEGESLDSEYVNAEIDTHAHGMYLTTTSCPGIFSRVII